jgi:hypothetical protein
MTSTIMPTNTWSWPVNRWKLSTIKLANSTGYQEGDRVWLYRPTRTKGKSPKRQSSWEGPCKLVTRITDVVCRIQKNPRSRMMVVHLDWLATYQGAAQDERTWGSRCSGLKVIAAEETSEGRKVMSLKEGAVWCVCPMQELLSHGNLETRTQQ